MTTPHERPEAGDRLPLRCPTCGHGELVDINYNEPSDVAPPDGAPMQESDSRQIATYSCGHEVAGPRIDRADQAGPALDIERRTSDETVPPPEETP